MPVLASFPHISFSFPWAYENYSLFLESRSPWLSDQNYKISSSLLANAFNLELNAQIISDISRKIESRYELSHDIPPFSWDNLFISHNYNDLNVGYAAGKSLPFKDVISSAQDINLDLLIIHEPYEMSFPGDKFPSTGLEHISPRQDLLLESSNYVIQHSCTTNCGRTGLHIRRGDYKHWDDGKHFHPDYFWVDLAANHLGQGLDIFVFTNEPDSELANKLSRIGCIVSYGSAVQDFTRMMYMDSIIGPPSTFSILARTFAKFCFGKDLKVSMIPPLLAT